MMLKSLKEIRQNMDYGRSELYSGQEGIPDYDCNSSGKSYLSNAESYLWNALDDLDKVIELVEGLNEVDIPGFEGTMDELDNLVNIGAK